MSNSKYKTSKKPVSNCGKVGGSTHGNRVFQGLEIKESCKYFLQFIYYYSNIINCIHG